jgi:large subunit ribosomal protein L24
MQRLIVGDVVQVIRGNDRGKRGKIKRVIRDRDRVVVEGINLVKRHVRATPQKAGGILEVEAPVHASKLMLIDPQTDKPTRVRHKVEGDRKVRVAKSGAVIAVERG